MKQIDKTFWIFLSITVVGCCYVYGRYVDLQAIDAIRVIENDRVIVSQYDSGYVGLLVGIIGVMITTALGYQIYNAIEAKKEIFKIKSENTQALKEYDVKLLDLEIIKLETKINLNTLRIDSFQNRYNENFDTNKLKYSLLINCNIAILEHNIRNIELKEEINKIKPDSYNFERLKIILPEIYDIKNLLQLYLSYSICIIELTKYQAELVEYEGINSETEAESHEDDEINSKQKEMAMFKLLEEEEELEEEELEEEELEEEEEEEEEEELIINPLNDLKIDYNRLYRLDKYHIKEVSNLIDDIKALQEKKISEIDLSYYNTKFSKELKIYNKTN